MFGKHSCSKSKNSPTFDEKWSGTSYAPHSKYYCPDCGERLHDEDDNYYCPVCDDYKPVNRNRTPPWEN